MPVFTASLFTANSNKSYLFNQAVFSNQFESNQSLILPLCHDSEWGNNALDEYLSSNSVTPRSHLSTQVKHIFNKPFCFFTDYAISESGHNDLLPMEYDFIVQDYLKHFGIDSIIKEIPQDINPQDIKLPYLDIWLYSFFGIVDIPLLSKPDTIIADTIKVGLSENQISHEKRITTKWNHPVTLLVIIELADINGNYHAYQLRLNFVDIGALHGNKGYKGVCENVGISTKNKSLMDDYKSDMLTGLKLYPDDYIRYANDDLNVYDVLMAYNELMKTVYDDLELTDYFQTPKLTIGATVSNIVSAAIFNWQNIESDIYHKPKARKSVLVESMGLASADYLRTRLINSNLYLLGKIHGGRCHNNNPLKRYDENAFADYDIQGAYSSIMQQLPLFIGRPWFYDSVESGEKTLKEFLRCHESDFDKWHYVIYVSTNELLEYEQDFFVSWIGASSSKMKAKNDKGETSYVPLADYNTGECRIYKKEIVNTPISSDSVKLIRSLSKQVRDDLLNKLIVKSAIGYKRKDKGKDWQSINLGELLINKLKNKRAEYKRLFKTIKDNRYNSLQELFKLIMNTTYGVMCSRHFVTSNVVVANNITQAIRLGMYLMEKGLNLQGSITDGCMGSLNNVVYPKSDYKVKLNNLTSLYLENSHSLGDKNLYLGALDNAKHIKLDWNELETPLDKVTHLPYLTIDYGDRIIIVKDEIINGIRQNNVNQWIDDKAHKHLCNLFPDFDYLLDFLKIETKDVYDSYAYHGAANYELKNPNYPKHAMRAYSGKKGVAIAIEYDSENDSLVRLKDYEKKSIPEVFLTQLKESKLNKLPPFVKTKILKSKDFSHHRYLDRSVLQCGDDVIETGMPNYCSLSQYTFLTNEQHDKWIWAFSKLKRTYQETFEIFFTDKDDKLDYDLMVKELCHLVNSGNSQPIKYLANKYKKNPSISRALAKMKAAYLRNELTFTKGDSNGFDPDNFVSLDDN